MNRLFVGLLILAVLLVSSLSVCIAMERVHRPIADALALAAQHALDGNAQAALAQAQIARARWEKYHRFTAAFADHSPMDEMDGLLAELRVYAQTSETTHFAATCAHLQFMATAMAESHLLSWWNLL